MERKLRAELEGAEGPGVPFPPRPPGWQPEPLGMAAPVPFLPGLARGAEGTGHGGPGGSRIGETGKGRRDPQPSGPSRTRCRPRNLQVLASRGWPVAPTSPAGPLRPCAPHLPSRPAAAPSVLAPDLQDVPGPAPPSPRSASPTPGPRTARPACLPPAGSRPSHPPAPGPRHPPPATRLRGSRARLQAGKVPRARPRGGGGGCRRLCGQEPAPAARSPLAPRRPPLVGTPDSQAARPPRRLRGGGGRFAASAARRAPCGPRGAPVRGAALGSCPGAALHARRLPRRRRALGGSPMCGCPCAGRVGAVGKEEGSVCFC